MALTILSRLYYRLLRLLAWCGYRPRSAAVAIWDRQRLLLVRNFYEPYFTLPGGLLGRKETPETGACREVAEEVGIRLHREQLRLVACHDQRWLFETHLAQPTPPLSGSWEIAWRGFVEPEEALTWKLTQSLRDYLEERFRNEQSARFETNSPETNQGCAPVPPPA